MLAYSSDRMYSRAESSEQWSVANSDEEMRTSRTSNTVRSGIAIVLEAPTHRVFLFLIFYPVGFLKLIFILKLYPVGVHNDSVGYDLWFIANVGQ